MPNSKISASQTISVIIPVYNAESRLPALLDALAAQTRPANSVFLIDDGSTDESVKVAEDWKTKHPGFPLRVTPQENQGPAAARNRGAHESQDEILVFIDSDCIPDRDFIEKMIAPFAKDEIVGVQGAYRCDQKEWPARFCQIEIEERYERMKRSQWIDFIGTYAAAYRRTIFIENGSFSTNFPMASGEDTEFSFRLADRGLKMVFQPEALVAHRHPTTLGRYLKQKYWRAVWRNLIYRHHSSRMMKDSYTPNTLKIQTLLGIVFPVSLMALAFSSPWNLIPGVILVLILLLSLPFSMWVSRKTLHLAILSPFVLFLRTVVFSVGTLHGILRGLWFRRKFSK